MTPMQRVFKEKRSLVVPLAVAAVINLAVLVLVLYPMARRVETTERRASTAQKSAADALTQFRRTEATLANRERADKELKQFYENVLPLDQTAARRMTYVWLNRLVKESNLDYANRNFKEVTEDDVTLARFDITMAVEGEYRDMRQLIHKLESAPQFIVIRSVALTKAGEEQDEALTLTLGLATYYRAPETPDRANDGR